MANLKSQKKRILTDERARQRNVQVRSRLKTVMKSAEAAISEKNAETIPGTVKVALTEVDRAVKKGVLHKNSGARKKSHLQVAANKALQG